MSANAGMPLTIAKIAEAAGCGVRAPQIAFHRFRIATPMQVLRQPDWNKRERRCCGRSASPLPDSRMPGDLPCG